MAEARNSKRLSCAPSRPSAVSQAGLAAAGGGAEAPRGKEASSGARGPAPGFHFSLLQVKQIDPPVKHVSCAYRHAANQTPGKPPWLESSLMARNGLKEGVIMFQLRTQNSEAVGGKSQREVTMGFQTLGPQL